jgi:O-antigen/teichoic acid export membrane protein
MSSSPHSGRPVSLAAWAQACKRLVRSYLSWETARTGLATVVDQTIVSGTSFCSSIIIARRCSKEELGLYALGTTVILFVIGLQNSLVSLPYIFYGARPGGGIDAQYTGSTLIHTCCLSTIGIIALSGVSNSMFYPGVIPGLRSVVWVLAGVITFILLREYARRMSFAWLQPRTASVMDLLVAVIQIGGLVLLSYMRLLSASSAFAVTGLACGLASSWWLVSKRQKFDIRSSRVISHLSLNWSFGKWIFAGGLVYTARSDLYPWFLATLHGAAATATLAACFGVVLFTNPFLIALSNFLYPKAAYNFTNGGMAALNRMAYKATLAVAVSMLLFVAGIHIVADRLVTLIYGTQYEGSGAIVTVLALSVMAGGVALGFDAGLYAVNRPTAIFRANLLGLAATVCFGFWMAKYYGPLGAAYSLLAASVLTLASKYLSFSRLSGAGTVWENGPGHSRTEILGAQSVRVANTETDS